jgi:hypothetical protein
MTMQEPNTFNIARRLDIDNVCNVQGMETSNSLMGKGITDFGKQEPRNTEGVIRNGLQNIEHGHSKELSEKIVQNTPG